MIRIAKSVTNFFTISQVAKTHGVTRQRIRNLCADGRIAGARLIGGRWVIPEGYAFIPRYNGRGTRGFVKLEQPE